MRAYSRLIYIDLFFSSRRRNTRCLSDWSSDVCSSDLYARWNRSTRASASVSRGAFSAGISRSATPIDTPPMVAYRSEEHTSELQSLRHLVCRLLLEKKKEDLTSAYIAT